MKNKILLIGGGTGGHVVPVYNLYKLLRKTDAKLKIAIVGSGSATEKQFYANLPDYFILKTGRYQRYLILENFWQIALFIWGVCQAFLILLKIRPKVIFSKGSSVSVPVIFWAKIMHIPYLIHESDAVMGQANKFAAGGAKKVFTGFPTDNYKQIEKKKLFFSGQILNSNSESGSKFDFGFSKEKPVVLVTGGSLGAINLNRSLFQALPQLLKRYNIIHQTGMKGFPEAIDIRAKLTDNMKSSYYVCDFLPSTESDDRKSEAMKKADLVVARAGATTIAEIAERGKPMILIPYPYAAGDHQAKNAEILKQKNACDIIADRELNPVLLARAVEKLFDDRERMREMGKLAKKFFPEDAVVLIGKEIINEIKK